MEITALIHRRSSLPDGQTGYTAWTFYAELALQRLMRDDADKVREDEATREIASVL